MIEDELLIEIMPNKVYGESYYVPQYLRPGIQSESYYDIPKTPFFFTIDLREMIQPQVVFNTGSTTWMIDNNIITIPTIEFKLRQQCHNQTITQA